ncbi:Sporulation related domain-containing protein [Candidatus Nitrotoga sp. HW29]|uniref:SPOR domain-containing protein n=1 Tax=Candidatus Nitrotoga sp. HW29 TaxID=2886963 RepID=UPI001EF30C14|nr:SPOR domain-containing protein [Candidatus Nitrotoga sp. HW29]CAH1905947.1 Sporulation related domain-containing protein [Candidatus Nitrotoga sp. HW29]
MSKNSSTRSAAPRRGSSLLTGILVGMVVGLVIAGGVAWYILKTPGSFVNNVPHETIKLAADSEQQFPVPVAKTAQVPASTAASGVDESKPRFEFYKVLTDKQDATVPIPKSSDNAATIENKSAPVQSAGNVTVKETYFLQAGSFSNAEDADKLKAKLAMLGIEASVQIATIPDKGVWHRVHIGPYKGREEMNNALAVLKQNGVNATPMLAK